ncbi:MAG: lipid II flippase MurJ [Planctomycetota bacterium]
MNPAPSASGESPSPEGRPGNVAERVAGAAIVIASFQALAKVAGFLVKWIVSLFGRGRVADAYFTAENALGKAFQFTEDVMQPAFLPIFLKESQEAGETAAWRFARQVLGATALLATGFALAVILRPEIIVETFAKGFSPEKKALTASIVRMMFPALLFLSVSSITYVLLNGYKRFGIPAASDAVSRFSFVLLAAAGFCALGPRPHVLAAVTVLAALLRLGVQVWGLRDKREPLFCASEQSDRPSPWGPFLVLALPLFASFAVALLRDMTENRLAAAADEGTYATLRYTKSLWQFPVTFLPNALSIAMFPFLCEMYARGDRKNLEAVVRGALRYVLLFFLPATVFSLALREPLIAAVYGRGVWTAFDVSETARAFGLCAWGLPFFALEIVVLQTFYAMRTTWIPVAAGIAASGLQIALSIWGADASPFDVLGILALAYPATRALKNVVLLGILSHRIGRAGGKPDLGFYPRVALLTVLAGAAAIAGAALADRILPGVLGLPGPISCGHGSRGEIFRFARVASGFLAWAGAFVVLAHFLRIPEWREALAFARTRLGRILGRSPDAASPG